MWPYMHEILPTFYSWGKVKRYDVIDFSCTPAMVDDIPFH